MIDTVLGVIKDEMVTVGIPYQFMTFTAPVPNRYWVGEYSETVNGVEDGYEEGTLILTGTTKELWSTLMDDRNAIKNHFPPIEGLRKATEAGTVVIFYENSFPVPTGDANLKRIQVNLKIKSWKGMN